MKKEKQQNAFPGMESSAFGQDTGHYHGMGLRDYFAAKAMQSIITRLGGGPLVRSDEQDTFSMVAEESYKYADAMLKQREL